MLAEILRYHFTMINSRFNVFCGIIKSFILCRGSNYKDLAEGIENSDTFLDSKIKSISRFLEGDNIDLGDYHSFIEEYFPTNKMLLSLDRTIWEFGGKIRNILILSVSYDKIGMPVMFKFIQYKGTCTAADQVEIVEEFIQRFGDSRIAILTADREFDNEKFITYLHNKGVNYALRIRKTNRILDETGNKIRVSNFKEVHNFETKFYTVPAKIDHIKLSSSEYLSIVSSFNVTCGLTSYRRRWDIESAFKGCKTSGFQMEDTHITNPKRLENFIKCLFIAYAITIKTGYVENQRHPIKFKKTLGCKAYSILQYGIKKLKEAFIISQHKFDSLIKSILFYQDLNLT